MPKVPVRTVRTEVPAEATSAARRRLRSTRESKSTVSSSVWERVSCTCAIVVTRRIASPRAALASSEVIRRAWSRIESMSSQEFFLSG